MLASNGPIKDRPDWVYEFKYDGYRALAIKEATGVRFMSRNGKDATPWWPNLVHALEQVPGSFIIDCEVCLLDARGIPDFEAMRRAVASKATGGFTLHAFDLLFFRGRDLRKQPLVKRKERLEMLLRGRHAALRYISHIFRDGVATYEFAVKLGMEGVVSKRAQSRYLAGRGHNWIKTKPPGIHAGWKRPLRDAQG